MSVTSSIVSHAPRAIAAHLALVRFGWFLAIRIVAMAHGTIPRFGGQINALTLKASLLLELDPLCRGWMHRLTMELNARLIRRSFPN